MVSSSGENSTPCTGCTPEVVSRPFSGSATASGRAQVDVVGDVLAERASRRGRQQRGEFGGGCDVRSSVSNSAGMVFRAPKLKPQRTPGRRTRGSRRGPRLQLAARVRDALCPVVMISAAWSSGRRSPRVDQGSCRAPPRVEGDDLEAVLLPLPDEHDTRLVTPNSEMAMSGLLASAWPCASYQRAMPAAACAALLRTAWRSVQPAMSVRRIISCPSARRRAGCGGAICSR